MARVEDLQYTLGEGPIIEAALSGRPVLVPDLRDVAGNGQWPVFAVAVAEQPGIGALFALPLQLGAINVGVLGLYRAVRGSMGGAELRDVLRAAGTAVLMLLGVGVGSPDGEADGWDHSWSSRAEVHQATGMVIAQLDVDAQTAFVRLRGYAYSRERLLGDIARDVVTGKLRFTEDMT